MDPATYRHRVNKAMCHMKFSMQIATLQVKAGRYFAFAHPGRASSRDLGCVKAVRELPGVVKVPFDMCMFGLTAPSSKNPIKKRTILMTKCSFLAQSLQG